MQANIGTRWPLSASLLLFVSILAIRPAVAHAECKSPAADALRADARRASQWNWGWGSLFAASALAHSGLALATDDADQRVALWTGAAKSTVGTLNQMIRPIRIYRPRGSCSELGPQLVETAEIERRKRNWFAHASIVAVNLVGFGYVQYRTGDLALSLTGAVLGSVVGEITIFTTPSRVREGGFALETLSVVPTLGREHRGLLVGAHF